MPETICKITKSGFCLRTNPALGKVTLVGHCGEPNTSPRCPVCPWIPGGFRAPESASVEFVSHNSTTAIIQVDDIPTHAIIGGILVKY